MALIGYTDEPHGVPHREVYELLGQPYPEDSTALRNVVQAAAGAAAIIGSGSFLAERLSVAPAETAASQNIFFVPEGKGRTLEVPGAVPAGMAERSAIVGPGMVTLAGEEIAAVRQVNGGNPEPTGRLVLPDRVVVPPVPASTSVSATAPKPAEHRGLIITDLPPIRHQLPSSIILPPRPALAVPEGIVGPGGAPALAPPDAARTMPPAPPAAAREKPDAAPSRSIPANPGHPAASPTAELPSREAYIPTAEDRIVYDMQGADAEVRQKFIDQLTTQAPITVDEFMGFVKSGINTDHIDAFEGRPGMVPEKFVTHHTVEIVDDPAQLAAFMRDREVGVQYYIDRDGKVFQFMRNPDWITGQASGANSVSAGVEIAAECGLPRLCKEFWNTELGYTPLQIRANALLNVKWLLEQGVVPSRNSAEPMAKDSSVVGHADVGDVHGYDDQPDGSPDFMDPFYERMVKPLYEQLRSQGLDSAENWDGYVPAPPNQTAPEVPAVPQPVVKPVPAEALPAALAGPAPAAPAIVPRPAVPEAIVTTPSGMVVDTSGLNRMNPGISIVLPKRAAAPVSLPQPEIAAGPAPAIAETETSHESMTELHNPYAALSVPQLAEQLLNRDGQGNPAILYWPNDRLRRAVEDLLDNGQTFTNTPENGDQISINRRNLELLLAFAEAGLHVEFNSFTDGGHSSTSYHYSGEATDYGITGNTADIYQFLWRNKESLGVGELIWGGMPDDGSMPNLRNGQPFEYSDEVMAVHAADHHLHVSFAMRPPDQPLEARLFGPDGKLRLDAADGDGYQGPAPMASVPAAEEADVAAAPAPPVKIVVPPAETPAGSAQLSNPFVVAARDNPGGPPMLNIVIPESRRQQAAAKSAAEAAASAEARRPKAEAVAKPLADRYHHSGMIQAMLPGAPSENVTAYSPLVLAALAEFGIADDQMVLYTFSTIRPEWGKFEPINEFPWPNMEGTCEAAGIEYGPGCQYDVAIDPETAEGLRNSEPGDGVKYHGRGFIQLTGKGNYMNYGELLGIDLVGNPDMALDPVVSARILAAYMKANESRIRTALDAGNMGRARAVVNGGTRGLGVFEESYGIGQEILSQQG